jgi:cytochrome c-type biogenesis protein CcmH
MRGPSASDMAAAATMSPEDRQKMIHSMVDGLAARLKDKPDDVDGWMRLGRAYTVLGEPDRARDALRNAADHAPRRADVLTAYAQALYTPAKAADKPPPEYLVLMRRILALDPDNAQALWFVANDAAASGDRKQAADLFRRLLARLPPNAPLRPQVQRQLDVVQGG